MRRVRYCVASSLDGYIAGPSGEFDWIPHDPEIDFAALFAQFDTFLVGRTTYEEMERQGRGGSAPGTTTYVFSDTMKPEEHPGVAIVRATEAAEVVTKLRAAEGKDIWLFGGGVLFRALAEAKLVDTVEVAVIPILLGGGISLYPPPSGHVKLVLTSRTVYETSGIVLLRYKVE